MYFLLHYIEISRLIEPARFWSNAFERKNRELKTYILTIECFKNMTWTIAMRNQIHLAYARKKNVDLKAYRLRKIIDQCETEINSIFSNIPYLPSYEFVEQFEIKFKEGTIIFLKCNNNLPVFAIVHTIYKMGDKVCLILETFTFIGYDENVCAYFVETKELGTEVCFINDITLLFPLNIIKCDDNISLIISKYEL